MKTRLSRGVGAGTRAVTPATGRSGARAAACWRSPPWGAGPSPHARWAATPHRWWRGHSAGWRWSTGWRADSLRQHSTSGDFLSINLTSVHVFECLLGLVGGLKLHISTAPVQVRVESVHWHVDSFDCPISRKDFLDMFLGDIPGESP